MTGTLSDDIKAVVSTVFKEEMEKGEKQCLYMIRVAIRRNSFLSRMVTNKRLVKQIQDFIRYQLPQTTEAIPEEENSLLTSDYVVSLDTASSLVTGITRRRWPQVDNKVVTSRFKKYRSVPSKAEIERVFRGDEVLNAIFQREGLARCYGKVRTLFSAMKGN